MGLESKMFATAGQEINKAPEDVENKEPKEPEEETVKPEDDQETKEKMDVEKSVADLKEKMESFIKGFSNKNDLNDDAYIEKIDREASNELFGKGEKAIAMENRGIVKANIDQMRVDDKLVNEYVEKLKPIAEKYNQSLSQLDSEEFAAKIDEFENELKNIIKVAEKQGEEEKVKYNFVDLNNPKNQLRERIFSSRDKANSAVDSLKIISLKLNQGIKKGVDHGM